MITEPDKIIPISLTVTRRDHEEGILKLTIYCRSKTVFLGPRSWDTYSFQPSLFVEYQPLRGRLCLR